MKNMKLLKIIGLILAIAFPCWTQAKVLFKDCVDNYKVKTKYTKAAAIKYIKNKGGCFWVDNITLADGSIKKLIAFNSGQYGKMSIIGVDAAPKERFGQIRYELGTLSPVIITMGMKDNKGQFGALVDIDPAGFVRYHAASLKSTNFKIPRAKLADICINYDLKKKTYNLVVNNKILVKDIPFKSQKFSTPKQIILGATYWRKKGGGILKGWSWQSGKSVFPSKSKNGFTVASRKVDIPSCESQTSITKTKRPFFINLGDYAKGDGSDETEAIQKAIDALQPGGYKENKTRNHPGGVLYIPRPKKFYGISKTIKFVEKWNTSVICESPVWGTRFPVRNVYFRWIGPDNGTMFLFRSCKGMSVKNLSMAGIDGKYLARAVKKFGSSASDNLRLTKGVTGIVFGPETARGFQTTMTFDHLTIRNVSTGMYLGRYPSNGPDVRELNFRMTCITFSDIGIVAGSANLASVTFTNLFTNAEKGARHAIHVKGGELLVMNWNGNSSRELAPGNSEVRISAGGIQIIKAWSEWHGPFLTTAGGTPEPGSRGKTHGLINNPVIIEGVRHYTAFWADDKYKAEKSKQYNPVPISIQYNRLVPLHLIGCSLWGGVKLDVDSKAVIIDQGTVFIDPHSIGFTGEGITRYGRIIHLGVVDPANKRVITPYVVDRRNTPGIAVPTKGVWQRGDRINNIEPDPNVPAKACAGWICIEAGEPGKWVSYGQLEKK